MDDTRPTKQHERQPAEDCSGTTVTPTGHHEARQGHSQHDPLAQTVLNLPPFKSVHIHSSGHIYANKWLMKRKLCVPTKSPCSF